VKDDEPEKLLGLRKYIDKCSNFPPNKKGIILRGNQCCEIYSKGCYGLPCKSHCVTLPDFLVPFVSDAARIYDRTRNFEVLGEEAKVAEL